MSTFVPVEAKAGSGCIRDRPIRCGSGPFPPQQLFVFGGCCSAKSVAVSAAAIAMTHSTRRVHSGNARRARHVLLHIH